MRRPTWGQMILIAALLTAMVCSVVWTGFAYYAHAQGNIGGTLPPALVTPDPAYPPPATPITAYPPPTPDMPPPVTSDLQLSLKATAFVRRGEPVRLAYTVLNAGPYPARGVVFMAVLPSGLYFSRVSAGHEWDCTVTNATGLLLDKPVTVTCWRNDFLMVGVGELVILDADVRTGVIGRDMLAMRAFVVSKGVDYSPASAGWLPGVE